jgi:hypothetical protein
VQIIDLDTGACVHWFRIDGPVGQLYDLGVVGPMVLGFASNEILGLITMIPWKKTASLRGQQVTPQETSTACR